jgi:hypothetical protein
VGVAWAREKRDLQEGFTGSGGRGTKQKPGGQDGEAGLLK